MRVAGADIASSKQYGKSTVTLVNEPRNVNGGPAPTGADAAGAAAGGAEPPGEVGGVVGAAAAAGAAEECFESTEPAPPPMSAESIGFTPAMGDATAAAAAAAAELGGDEGDSGNGIAVGGAGE